MSTEEGDVFSGSVSPSPTIVNVQPAGQMMLVERSPVAQVIGVLVIIYNVIITGSNFLGLMALSFLASLDDPEFAAVEELPMGILIIAVLLTLIPAVMGIIGGYQMFKFQKKGLYLVLGSIALGWVISMINTMLTSDYAGGSGSASLDAGLNGICGLVCVGICGAIVCIPLLFAGNGLE
jgi:hypothetical protein